MSPRRTEALHQSGDLQHLLSIRWVSLQGPHFARQGFAFPQTLALADEGLAYRLRPAEAGRFQTRESLKGLVIEPYGNRSAHISALYHDW